MCWLSSLASSFSCNQCHYMQEQQSKFCLYLNVAENIQPYSAIALSLHFLWSVWMLLINDSHQKHRQKATWTKMLCHYARFMLYKTSTLYKATTHLASSRHFASSSPFFKLYCVCASILYVLVGVCVREKTSKNM